MSKKSTEQKTGKPSNRAKDSADLKEEDLEKIEGAWGTMMTDLWHTSGSVKKKTPTDESTR